MSWKTVHAHLSRLARDKAAADADEARWLVCAARERVHVHLGYGSLAEYLERLFGYGPRLAHEKLRVARALEALPAMREALASAELSWSAVRELSRVAAPKTDAAWIAAAAGKTVREVERMVSGRKPGDLPDAPPDPAAMTTVLRLEISADTLAAFREARDACTREVGHRLDDDALVRMIAERALAVGEGGGGGRNGGEGGGGGRNGNGGDGRSRYQVKVALCPECGRGDRAAAGELHRMAPVRVEQALCDAQLVVDGGAASRASARTATAPARATQTIPPRIRRSVIRRDGGCIVPGCRNSVFREIHHVVARAGGGRHDPGNLAGLTTPTSTPAASASAAAPPAAFASIMWIAMVTDMPALVRTEPRRSRRCPRRPDRRRRRSPAPLPSTQCPRCAHAAGSPQPDLRADATPARAEIR